MSYVFRIKCRICEEGFFYTCKYFMAVSCNSFFTAFNSILLDLRYSKRLLNGNKKTPYKHLGANDTYHTDYTVMSKIFKQIDIIPDDVLVDVGCGKGRIINYWISQGVKNKIIGLELDPEIAARTAKQYKNNKNISIIVGDAIEYLPQDGTVFYFYNPFELEKVREFENRLLALPNLKNLKVIYYNPKSIEVFCSNKWNIKYINFEKDLGLKRWGRLNKYHDLAVINWNGD